MDPTKNNLSHDEEKLIDRLVDGELSESERRSLLSSLDAEPEGWRRCALAFLEAQTWRETFGEFTPPARKPPSEPAPRVLPPSPKKQKKKLGAMGTVMAMAASFLMALGLGAWALRSPRQSPLGNPANNMIVDNNTPRKAIPIPDFSVGGHETIPQPKRSPSAQYQMVQLNAPGLTGNNQPLQIPAMPRDRLNEDFFKSIPEPIPAEVRQALEHTGHEVRVYSELVPVQMEDGRQLVIPMAQVDVKYDTHRAN